jgi:small-conductance mechanosensitive channel
MWKRESRSSNEEGHLLLAGQIISRLARFSEIFSRRNEILENLVNTIEMGDLLVLVALGWFTIPVVRVIYTFYYAQYDQATKVVSLKKAINTQPIKTEDQQDASSSQNPPHAATDVFFSSTPFYIANLATEVFQRACLVYLIDCLVIVADIVDPRLDIAHHELSLKFAKIIYSIWAASRLMAFKRYLLCLAAKRPETKLGKVGLYDRILDILILFCLILAILDIMHVEVGPGLASLFAFGGVGTLVLTLASKDLAHQLVCGVVVSTSENFYVGDHIRLGNDTRGAIDYIGWLYTDVRGKSLASVCNNTIPEWEQVLIRHYFVLSPKDTMKLPPAYQMSSLQIDEYVTFPGIIVVK